MIQKFEKDILIVGIPLDSVPQQQDSARMKLTMIGSLVCLTKSVRKRKMLVATLTIIRRAEICEAKSESGGDLPFGLENFLYRRW
ncbi:hypothetical protein PanWU01x14_009630 [Parasponia andersonii]|uniref:Uncharacterized protein n=1 Tax=Parasponia andersonii TaxID=3476 RepID=A0A2P5E2H4_PARAD|nr:hypothetical protein PanWU01x14_009630 [Parasponia andersonii]